LIEELKISKIIERLPIIYFFFDFWREAPTRQQFNFGAFSVLPVANFPAKSLAFLIKIPQSLKIGSNSPLKL
jgi:hypothetical protein